MKVKDLDRAIWIINRRKRLIAMMNVLNGFSSCEDGLHYHIPNGVLELVNPVEAAKGLLSLVIIELASANKLLENLGLELDEE